MAVALVTTSNTPDRATASPSSTTRAVNAGTNICAFATVGYDAASGMSITGVTLGGVAMTSAGAAANNATGQEYVEVWYLAGGATGSQTLAVTVSGTITDIYTNLVEFSDVHQTTPIRPGTYQTKTGSGTTASITVSSDPNDLTLTVIDPQNGVTSTDQTSDGTTNAGGRAFGSDHATTAAASVTHNWTIVNGAYALIGFSIQSASAPSDTLMGAILL